MLPRNRADPASRRPPMARLAKKIVLAAFLTALARPASAAQCDVGVTPVSFGGYDPFAGPRDAGGGVTVDCNGNVNPLVQLGAGGSGNANDRRMTSGTGDVLRYNVYGDAARSQVFTWQTLGRGGGVIPLYGRIFAGQPVAPGAYQDLLTVTVQF
jgi:spore coat protein U-like protein